MSKVEPTLAEQTDGSTAATCSSTCRGLKLEEKWGTTPTAHCAPEREFRKWRRMVFVKPGISRCDPWHRAQVDEARAEVLAAHQAAGGGGE